MRKEYDFSKAEKNLYAGRLKRQVTLRMDEGTMVVAHTEEGETIRIISARLAGKGERKIYEEG